MCLTRRRMLATLGALAAGSAVPARADDWPTRPLRILVGTAPGGSPDILSRLLADKISERLGQSVYVENNASGGGAVALTAVQRATPDGTSLTMMTAGYASGVAVNKFVHQGRNSFSYLSMVCAYPIVYAVAPNSPIKSFADLIARAKAEPGKLTYTITSLGSVYHLLGKWIDMQAGTDMVPIPYRGASPAVTDVLSGRVDVMLETATSGFPRIHSRQLRVVAITSPKRYPLLPDAPTVAETLPGVEYMSWLGLVTTPGTPKPIVDRLNAEIRRALDLSDVKQRLAEGGNIPTPTTPEAMGSQIKDEIGRWKSIVEANKIKVE
jgi:tripartite-type tricarboxylate transporter receptor subunit TctC